MSWTAERTEQLKKFWADGLTASQIAARLLGVSRNSVLGKVWRLGLPTRNKGPGTVYRTRTSFGRANGSARGSGGHAKRAEKLALPRRPLSPVRQLLAEPFIPQPEPFVEPKDRKPLLVRKDDGCLHANDELVDSSCRWPCGDPGTPEFGFCGQERIKGAPYCLPHARIAYRIPNAPTPPAAEQEAPAPAREKVAA
jgi:GcrA cell cycle regulator